MVAADAYSQPPHIGTRYEIAVENPRGVSRRLVSLQLDGVTLPANQGRVPLVDDGTTHQVHAVVG